MTKRKIAFLLAIVMLFNNMTLLANTQLRIPANGLDYVNVSHGLTGSEGNIYPKAEVSFSVVDNKGNTNVDGSHTDSAHQTEYYDFKVTDSLGETVATERLDANSLNVINGKATINIEEHLSNTTTFKNGRLYKLVVQPGHLHQDEQGKYHAATLDPSSNDPVRFFITDLNTIAREVDGELEIVWEYIPNAIYQLTYIDMDAKTKDEVDGKGLNNYTGVGSKTLKLKAEELDKFTENGVTKVKYVLENTLPGQRYSAYVLVDGMDTNSFLTDNWNNVGVNKTTPKIASGTKSINLEVVNIGNNRIKLSWTLRSWMNGNIDTIKIWRRGEGETTNALIGTIHSNGDSSSDNGTYEHDEPTKNSYYQVEFVLKDGTSIYTAEKLYIPYELREKPLKPQVPKPFSDLLEQTEITENKDEYIVKGDDVPVEDIKENTFHIKNKSPLQVQFVWDAPTRKDANGNSVIDYDIKYDIWVANQVLTDKNTATMEPVIKDLSFSESDVNGLIKTQGTQEVVGFKTILDKYIDKNGNMKNLISNQTYYIRIVAKKAYGEIIEESQSTIVTITVDKNGDIYAPPVLAKPPLKAKEGSVTKESATIEWLEKWYEIKANDVTRYNSMSDEERFFARLWNSRVYTDNNGTNPIIRFEGGNSLTQHDLLTKQALDTVKAEVKAKGEDYDTNYSDREVVLGSDVQYEVKTVLYDKVIEDINQGTDTTTPAGLKISKWVIDNESNSTEGWKSASPTNNTHDGLDWKDYTVTGLSPNTKYLVLIRAYRILEDGTKMMQTYPSYVIITTESDFDSPEAVPTVPILNADGTTDTSVSVWWTYNSDFKYELVYGRVDDVEKATPWPFTISDQIGDKDYVADGDKAKITINGLLPDTGYYVWLRASQKEGDKISAWSNSVYQVTDELGNPDAPRGLGKADYKTILALGQDFQPVSSDYITVEWMRDQNDVEEKQDEETSPVEKQYSYAVEFADNPKFQDALTFTVGGSENTGEAKGYEILDKTTIKFTGLEANRKYYVRVKTVLTVKIDDRTIIKESEFTDRIGIYTKTSSDEYDGGDNPNIIEYEKPVEESYKNGIWTYEIVDAAKVTTQILESNNYYYTVTLENYNNKHDAVTRSLKMPIKVLSTLANRGMTLQVVTNIATYEIPGEALKSYINQYQGTDKVQFDMTRKSYSDISNYVRSYPETYQSGEVLKVTFRGNAKNTTVNTFNTPIKVKLKLDVATSYNYSSFNTYLYNYASGNWESYPYQVDTVNNKYLTYNTMYTGLNALYSRTIENSNIDSNYLMNALTSMYNITGLGSVYEQSDEVKASQYVKLMLGIAENSRAINLTQQATSADYAAAKASGIYISNAKGNVTREQALAGAVRLYEIKKGYKIKPSNYTIDGVSSAYREAASKAYAIGMIESLDEPRAAVTYGELCDWIALAID